MKDVFKELKVLGRKGKSCTAQINKDILETIFTPTITFDNTVIVTTSRVDTWAFTWANTWAPFLEETPVFISSLSSLTRESPPSRMDFLRG